MSYGAKNVIPIIAIQRERERKRDVDRQLCSIQKKSSKKKTSSTQFHFRDITPVTVDGYLWLVYTIAKKRIRAIPYGVDLEELVSYGTIGLIDAVSKFNPEVGVKFTTYANIRINGAITDGLRDNYYVCSSVETEYVGEDEDTDIVAIGQKQLETEHVAYRTMVVEEVRKAIRELPPRERFVVEMNDLEGIPQAKIAKKLGVSPALVSIIRSNGLRILRLRLKNLNAVES